MKKCISVRKIMGCLGSFMVLAGLAACGKEEIPAEEKVFEESDYTLTVQNVQDFDISKGYEYQEGTDWDCSYLNLETQSPVAKGEKGYYVRLDEFVYFCDFDRGKLTPLCNRPDCLHDKEVDENKKQECTAYVRWGNAGNGIQYYDGKLYANVLANEPTEEGRFIGDKLVAICEDGSSREVLDYELDDSYNFKLHRGSIYYTSDTDDPDTRIKTQCVYRIDMESGQKTEIIQLTGGALADIYPVGDYVYILIQSTESEGARKIVYEISTGKAKVGMGIPADNLLMDKEGKLLLCTVGESNQLIIESTNLDGSEREEVGNLRLEDLEGVELEAGTAPKVSYYLGMDDTYFYVFCHIEKEAELYYYLEHPMAAVFDRNTGELLRTFALESQPPAQNLGVDDTYVFYICDVLFTGETKVYWMKKEDIWKPEAAFSMMEP